MNYQLSDIARNFDLAPALASEILKDTQMPLCKVILRNERRYPWLILVPQRYKISGGRSVAEEKSQAVEVSDLLPGDRAVMWREVDEAAAALKAVTRCDKINIAAFGNVTQQLHVHILARSASDPHWPGSAVGVDEREPYPSGSSPGWWPAFLARLALSDLTSP
ncbi:MAG: HIT domain-containing protein [Pseudomonadota bacterium]